MHKSFILNIAIIDKEMQVCCYHMGMKVYVDCYYVYRNVSALLLWVKKMKHIAYSGKRNKVSFAVVFAFGY